MSMLNCMGDRILPCFKKNLCKALLTNKKSNKNTSHGKPILKLLVKRHSKIIHVIVIVLGCLKALKVLIAEDTVHFILRTWRNQTRFDVEASFLWTTSHRIEGAMKAAKKGVKSIILPVIKLKIIIMTSKTKYLEWCYSSTFIWG